MNQDNDTPYLAAIGLLATASGARSMTGVAAVAQARARAADADHTPRLTAGVSRRVDRDIAKATAALAMFEMMADKAPNIPDRVDAGPLLGRVAAGAVIGASVAQMTGHDRRNAAIYGAVAAFVGAQLSFRFRRSLMRALPAFAAGLVEDAAVVGLAATGATLLAPRRQVTGDRW